MGRPGAPAIARALAAAAGRAAGLLGLGFAGALLLQALRLRVGLRRARRLMDASPPFETRPQAARRHVLLLGDSTGVGVGGGPQGSIGALIARDHPDWQVDNACCSGARLADVAAAVRARAATLDGYDLLLLHVGGNDVLRGARRDQLARDTRRVMAALGSAARRLVWLGPANIGHAPVFHPPLSWWLSHRTGRACRLFRREAHAAGARFLNFFGQGPDDPFGHDRGRWYARDGVHPSADSYRRCYEALRRSAPFRATAGPRRRRPALNAAPRAAAGSARPAAAPSGSAASAR